MSKSLLKTICPKCQWTQNQFNIIQTYIDYTMPYDASIVIRKHVVRLHVSDAIPTDMQQLAFEHVVMLLDAPERLAEFVGVLTGTQWVINPNDSADLILQE